MTTETSIADRHPRAVVVTGGGTGIGAATAHAFAARGDHVLVVGRTRERVDEAASSAPGPGTVEAVVDDVTDPCAAERIVDAARTRLGALDVLVNNAGTAVFETLANLERASVRVQVETNLVAPIFLTQAALELLSARGGVVVNVSSAGSIGLRAMPENAVYAATKVGLDSLTRTWAVELAPRGIRVVAVAPGLIDTGVALRAGMPADAYAAFLDEMRPRIPSGDVGAGEDVAWWIVALAEPGARYANGGLFPVDGGLSVT